MTVQCKRVFTCAKLARQKKCSWAFKKALNINCKRPLTRWQQNGLVKNSCRRSCRNCVGTFLWFWNTLNFLQYHLRFYCNALVLNIFTGNTRAGIIPGLSNNELELEPVSIGRDQEKYRHQGNNDLIHIYEGWSINFCFSNW